MTLRAWDCASCKVFRSFQQDFKNYVNHVNPVNSDSDKKVYLHQIRFIAKMNFTNSLEFARSLDAQDELKEYRNRFHIPVIDGKEVVYLCGNSLGLQPKSTKEYIDVELQAWAELGVEGHFKGKNPWKYYHHLFSEPEAKIVGALPHEVVVMNNLTANLHLMMVSFYRPTQSRYKIMIEGGAFPSDQYAVESQVRFHGFNPDEAIIELVPRKGEHTIHIEDILQKIEENKDSLALVLLGGVNYYTGQAFEMDKITEAAHKIGALAGYDLAHGAGNLLLKLHDWNVDFAVWCTYKYLNSGPGGTSGVFVHERWANAPELPRFAGWWGYDEATRFQMKKGFKPMYGAAGWQLSNAQILPMAAHKAALDIFSEVGMEKLRAKSDKLTAFTEFLIRDNMQKNRASDFEIITPSDPKHRGAQLSLLALKNGRELFQKISDNHIIADWREPNVIRIAPAPLYNSFEDVFRFADVLGS